MLGAWSAAKRELALAHADGRLSDEDYLARVASVRREQAAAPPARAGAAAPADRALAYHPRGAVVLTLGRSAQRKSSDGPESAAAHVDLRRGREASDFAARKGANTWETH